MKLVSEQTIAVKAKLVDEATESMKAASSIVVVDYRGLTVAEVTDLRKQLRDEGVKMQVIKNKVLERAAEKAGFDDLKETFNGPTAVVFSSEDPVAGPKIVHNFAKSNDALELKGGVIDGKVASLEKINEYAALPSRDELLSTLANILQAPVRNFAYGVKAIADKKQEDGGDAA
ncbi:50S ribosomal protein L10 [Lentilactobacillus parafarraginis]|uniref:Large ribosomal subunit protein uL10 n=3 Tax=Lentilactobacillus parafarraginis TaxID=390842 RepID=A0A0R1YS01_9LACO|nr:ribosomal protein L10 [Lentilactobacillus parafarraginis F0439]KRM45191.1 ribosomal protein L10 [Lentilactobacillus parafarraginis DSM 18390 = JCM 14109]TLQ19542.1 50S ribosomal protein L10 [Lentilactobacillus parafarraginis]